jgi:hypothetical protein
MNLHIKSNGKMNMPLTKPLTKSWAKFAEKFAENFADIKQTDSARVLAKHKEFGKKEKVFFTKSQKYEIDKKEKKKENKKRRDSLRKAMKGKHYSGEAQDVFEKLVKEYSIILFNESVNHDGYDEHGPKSNLYDLRLVLWKNDQYYKAFYHYEQWYHKNERLEYVLLGKIEEIPSPNDK